MKLRLHDIASLATRSIHADLPGGRYQYTDTFEADLSGPPFRLEIFTPTFACGSVIHPSNHGNEVQPYTEVRTDYG